MVRPVLTTPPTGQIVPLADAKLHLRVLHDSDDALIEAHIAASERELDGYAGLLGRCLLTQTWAVGFPNWAGFLRLPFPDIAAAEVGYVDSAGAQQVVDPALFELVEEHRGVELWFRPAFTRPSLSADARLPVTVTMTAGYGAAADVPADIVEAIKARVNQLYWQTPEADAAATIDRLLAKHRMVGL